MDRRQVIRQFLIIGGGLAFMPSCVYKEGKLSIQLHTIQVTPSQEQVLKELADSIIPPTDSPGAAELGAHLFALKMVDDCMLKEEQEAFIAGLKQLPADLKDPASLLAAAEKNKQQDLVSFLSSFRRLVIQGYSQSEYVMTNLLPYQLVPGKYYGCVELNSTTSKS
ncbi:gluconate 2-dehydrogenase subunit 3 family protein [Flavihumibacter sp. CACIAM 22H1]|uniref:gluconate 2-dehydrogenase subunit 3 family protein n=1 Tax=Flavihumibacter sp. CACIAM 22H1 TaxID=1812911 RepID=UPI0007A8ED64|nr:gluconate 2-dehydrogenase subunit 3 family protein [Flavihumibacter sp. CACIAM 22H1]KYP14879.1 MAG: hypothetical protein A1D16_07765 [Flavihumibacter sp. CACIAM 22H1]